MYVQRYIFVSDVIGGVSEVAAKPLLQQPLSARFYIPPLVTHYLPVFRHSHTRKAQCIIINKAEKTSSINILVTPFSDTRLSEYDLFSYTSGWCAHSVNRLLETLTVFRTNVAVPTVLVFCIITFQRSPKKEEPAPLQ